MIEVQFIKSKAGKAYIISDTDDDGLAESLQEFLDWTTEFNSAEPGTIIKLEITVSELDENKKEFING